MTTNSLNNSATIFDVDNIRLDANTISTTDTNGDLVLSPDGSGTVNIDYATQDAIAVYGASGALSELALTNGQLLIGSTGATPATATLTSSGATITITNGAGTINLETAAAASSFPTDSGTATPAGGATNVLGGTLMGTTGAADTITINADDNVVGTVASDSGSATPASNTFTIAGAGSITTSASGSTVTITDTGNQSISMTSLTDADSPYTVLDGDYYLTCDVSAGALQINFPNTPTTNRSWIVKDATGSADSFNITLTTVGGVKTIDGGTTFVMNTEYQAVQIVYNTTTTNYEVF